jgi:hypothetical protein
MKIERYDVPSEFRPEVTGGFRPEVIIEGTSKTKTTFTREPSGKVTRKKETERQRKIIFGKEDYGALFVGLLTLYGLYVGVPSVEQAIAIIGAAFLGWGGYTCTKSKKQS